jgi:hypothetical protein
MLTKLQVRDRTQVVPSGSVDFNSAPPDPRSGASTKRAQTGIFGQGRRSTDPSDHRRIRSPVRTLSSAQACQQVIAIVGQISELMKTAGAELLMTLKCRSELAVGRTSLYPDLARLGRVP